MADNVTAVSGAVSLPDNTTIATDNIGGVNYQRIKLTWGLDGTATDASSDAPLPVIIPTSVAVTGAVTTTPSSQITASVAPTTQWTVTTTPSSQWTVSVTPTTQLTVSNATSTGVVGAVMPSTQWTVSVTPTTQFTISVTPTTQFTVSNATSTGVIGAIMPSTQWTVSVTPTTQFTISVTPTTQFTVSNATSTGVIGAVMPSTNWDVILASGTLTSITNSIGITSSTAIRGAVMPSTQWTVSIGTSTATIGAVTQASSNWQVSQGTTSWRMNTNYLNAKELTNANIIATSTAVGFPNKLVAETSAQTIRVYRLYISALTACRFQLAGATTTSTVPLAEFCLPANGAIDLEHDLSGEPLFVSNSGGAFALGQNISAAAGVLTGFVQYTKS